MGDLNEFFSKSEFACKCGCGMCIINDELVRVLTDVREHFGVPLKVSSGNRCEDYNRKVGGSKRSQHKLGTAADIQLGEISPKAVADYVEEEHNPGGLGRYDTFTHVDVREGRARWGG